jgi:spore germination protein
MMLPVVFFIILIALMTYENVELKNLLPIAHNGVKPIMRGSAHIIDSALGCSIVSYIMPYFENVKETKKWIFIGVTIAISVYMVLIVMCLLVFGVIEVQYLSFPAILLAKIIEFKAELFERTESFFMAAWIPAIFANIVVMCTTAILNLKEIFNTKKTNRIILLIVPFIMISTFIPKNIIDVYEYLEFSNRITVYLSLIYFPILFIVVMLKGRGDKRHEK